MHGKFGLFIFHFTGLESHIHFDFFYIFMYDKIKDILRNIQKWKMT